MAQGGGSVQYLNNLSAKLRSTMSDEASASASPLAAAAASGPGSLQSKGRPGSSKSVVISPASRQRSRQGGELVADASARDSEGMRERYEELLRENEALKRERDRRTESYMRRETNYQSEIEDLKADLDRVNKSKPQDVGKMEKLRGEHRKIIDRLGAIQAREQASLQDQEKDMLRAFRARLWDVQFELETERSKKDDGALEWIEKTKTLGKELDWSRDEALRLDRTNQFLQKENARLKTQLRAQEDDREFIMKQMLGLKKENAVLKAQGPPEAARADGERPMTASGGSIGRPSSGSLGRARPASGGPTVMRGLSALGADADSNGSLAMGERIKELTLQQAESEERYKEVVSRLKRLLDVERRNLQAVRAAHAKDMQSRTELELLLRACVDDVRKEVGALRGKGANAAAGVGVDELGPKERERVLELLLSQERVVSLLYERTFPPAAPEDGTAAEAQPSTDA